MNSLSHVAIIMDGNGRWALKRNKSRNYGHEKGIDNIKNIIATCKKKKIKYLTLFVFSVDNWNRSKSEVSFLFNLLKKFLKKDINFLISNKIKIKIIGEKKNLDRNLLKNFKNIEKLTSENYDITINIAFNYSSKLEIINSINKILKKKNKTANIKDLEENLYAGKIPNPEILIRTGGFNRLSDFLLWQLSYAEFFFLKKLWPDFKSTDLIYIINKYKKIKRNFGSVNE